MSGTVRVAELERENAQLSADLAALRADYADLKQQLEWLKRQLFGRKSEKRLDVDPAVQGNLLAALGVEAPPQPVEPTETITYQRRNKVRDAALNDSGLRFGEDVPREIITVHDPEIEALPAEARDWDVLSRLSGTYAGLCPVGCPAPCLDRCPAGVAIPYVIFLKHFMLSQKLSYVPSEDRQIFQGFVERHFFHSFR